MLAPIVLHHAYLPLCAQAGRVRSLDCTNAFDTIFGSCYCSRTSSAPTGSSESGNIPRPSFPPCPLMLFMHAAPGNSIHSTVLCSPFALARSTLCSTGFSKSLVRSSSAWPSTILASAASGALGEASSSSLRCPCRYGALATTSKNRILAPTWQSLEPPSLLASISATVATRARSCCTSSWVSWMRFGRTMLVSTKDTPLRDAKWNNC